MSELRMYYGQRLTYLGIVEERTRTLQRFRLSYRHQEHRSCMMIVWNVVDEKVDGHEGQIFHQLYSSSPVKSELR